MSGALVLDVSDTFADKGAEAKLIELMEQNPSALWSVSKFVQVGGLVRARVDRAVISLEAKGRIHGETIGRTRVIRYVSPTATKDVGQSRPSGTGTRTSRPRPI